MSAVWWLPHDAGQPDQRTEIGRAAADALLELARERQRPRLGVDQRQVAEVGAGARDESALDLGRVVRQLPQQRLLREVAQPRVRHVRQQHVLQRREAQLAAAVAL